jgi:EpsI family protein
MRAVSPLRLAILSTLLVVAALLVRLPSEKSPAKTVKEPLQQAFGNVEGWVVTARFPMETRIVEALMLDDYLFQSFEHGKDLVTLYIGYYRTAKKVGAAHDPLVCFQGQGWQLKNRRSGDYVLTRAPRLKISFSSMIAERQDQRELIVYWFQANGKASASTHSQKSAMFRDRLFGRGEDNAFVRISVPINDEPPDVAEKRIFAFIENFYPAFYRYVTQP